MGEVSQLEPAHVIIQPTTWSFTGWSASAKEFAAGACGGCVSVIAGHPLDTLRVRQQQLGQPAIPMLSKLSRMVRTEGVLSPYKGLSYPLYSSALQSAVMFWSYGYALRLLQPEKPLHSGSTQSHSGGSSSTYSSNNNSHSTPHTIGNSTSSNSTTHQIGSSSSHSTDSIHLQTSSITEDEAPLNPSMSHVLLAGCFSGLAQFAFMTPIDVLKIRMQVQTTPHGTSAYLGPLRMVQHIVTQEGMKGLFRGITITALRDIPCFAMYFAAYTATTQAAQSLSSHSWPWQDTQVPHAGHSRSSSADSGMGMAPSHCDVQTMSHQDANSSSSSSRSFSHSGTGGSGIGAGSGGSSGASYSIGSDGGHHDSHPATSLLSSGAIQLLAGGCAGALSWLCVYPLDVIKSRMQAGSPCAPPGSSWLQVARNIHQRGSARAFTLGLGTTLWRAVLVNAACFAGYEQVMAVLNQS